MSATPVVRTAGVRNIANALTLVRLLLVPVLAVVLVHDDGQQRAWRVMAFIIFTVALATDFADGALARRRGLITGVGTFADPVADKALIGTGLVGLSLINELSWWITGVIMTRELTVTLLRLWVIRHGVIPASRGGKLKTLAQGSAICLYLLPLDGWLNGIAVTVMMIAVTLTVATGLDYVGRALALRRRGIPSRAH